MAFGLQRLDQVRQRLGGPAHQAHGVSLGFQDVLQVSQQRRVDARQFLSACSKQTDARSWLIGLACFPFSQAPFDRVERDACLPGDRAGAASSLRLGSQVVSPLLLIEQGVHLLVFLFGGERFHTLTLRIISSLWQVILGSPLSLPGAWLATRKHPYYTWKKMVQGTGTLQGHPPPSA